jgi:hypothetical protein
VNIANRLLKVAFIARFPYAAALQKASLQILLFATIWIYETSVWREIPFTWKLASSSRKLLPDPLQLRPSSLQERPEPLQRRPDALHGRSGLFATQPGALQERPEALKGMRNGQSSKMRWSSSGNFHNPNSGT